MSDALSYVRSKTDLNPDLALVLGSGLSGVAEAIEGVSIPYGDIPGIETSTVQTHAGVLKIGTLHGRTIVAMCGRLHGYEGYSLQQVTAPVRLMAEMGAKTILITNAAGGLNPDYAVGDLVAIEDHISFVNLSGGDPLRGTPDRFVSLNGAYDRHGLDALNAAGVTKRGTYCHVMGPSFETPAEVRMMRMLGGDLVGMSTVPEVMVARARGLKVCAISGVTNACVSDLNDPHVTTADEAWDALQSIAPKMADVLARVIPAL